MGKTTDISWTDATWNVSRGCTKVNSDCLLALKDFPDNYFSSVVTDPPYGLGKEPDIIEVMKGWIEKGYHEITGKGFMGKKWDAFVPQPIIWKEIFRVLKPGGHILVACGTRTQDWMAISLRFAGFEIRDVLTWHYGSGFPKSHDISKSIDRIKDVYIKGKVLPSSRKSNGNMDFQMREKIAPNPQSSEAKQWNGYGTALKPATEFWTLARKPLSEGNIAQNILKYGTGGINIDGCRISFQNEADKKESIDKNQHADFNSNGGIKVPTKGIYHGDTRPPENYNPVKGRFPANVIFSHHPECRCVGEESVKSNSHYPDMKVTGMGKNYGGKTEYIKEGERIKEETIEKWECHPDCPVRMLNEQSGESKSIGGRAGHEKAYQGGYKQNYYDGIKPGFNDVGGASRFFYCTKASKSERNKGVENFSKDIGHNRFDKCKKCHGYILQNPNRPSACKCKNPERENNIIKGNYHPTVKPISLMRWLVRLITPPDGICLDPFAGSGTTGIACKLEGFDCVLIEKEKEYYDILKARIDAWKEEKQTSLF